MVHHLLGEDTRNYLIDRILETDWSKGLGFIAWLARLGEKV